MTDAPDRGAQRHSEIIRRLREEDYRVRQRDNGDEQYSCQCPAHEDNKNSLEVGEGEMAPVMFCWAGCSNLDVLAALGLPSDFLVTSGAAEDRRAAGRETTAAHEALMADAERVRTLEEEEGWTVEALESLRVGAGEYFNNRLSRGVDERWVSWAERGGTGHFIGRRLYLPNGHRTGRDETKSLLLSGDSAALLYDRDELAPGSSVLVVEGGGAAIAARSLGYPTVSYPHAGFRPLRSWARLLRECEVYVVPDADAVEHGERVADGFTRAPRALVKVARLAGGFNDIADLLRAFDRTPVGRGAAKVVVEDALERAVERPKGTAGRKPVRRRAGGAWLRDRLGDGEWHRSSELRADAERDGHEWRTVQRAMERGEVVVDTGQRADGHYMQLANPFVRQAARRSSA